MLKRIPVEQVILGMFVHELCGPWMGHPFWRKRFLLDSELDLQRLHTSKITEVWIDVGKGLDVLPSSLGSGQANESSSSQKPRHHGLAEELRRAAKTCVQARQQLSRMFDDARLGRPLNAEAANHLVGEVTASVTRNPHALISLARIKTADDYTYMHSLAVCALMVGLAKRMGLDEQGLRLAGLSGLMHDLGKTAIPLEVLNKPGPLDDEEWALMREHPRHGAELLTPLGLDEQVIDACLHHHEKVDGTGYPHGLQQQEIGLFARMAAICDVYDAVTSDRPYKKGWSPAEALHRMAQWCPQHFDRALFEQFVQTVGIYPLGSLVRLQSQHLAVVVDTSVDSLLAPRVKVFYSLEQHRRIAPYIEDLSSPRTKDRIVAREELANWSFADLDSLWMGAARLPQTSAR